MAADTLGPLAGAENQPAEGACSPTRSELSPTRQAGGDLKAMEWALARRLLT